MGAPLQWVLVSLFTLPLLVAGEGVHLPIQRATIPRRGVGRRDGTGVAGLGDDVDVAYSVLINVGGVAIPFLLDTGSSDLWSITDACTDCSTSLPRYPQSRFNSTGIPIHLAYGDSFTGTHADGEIGSDSVTLAGLSSSSQYFAAVTDTNTTVTQSGASGIFGLGFPINSEIWSDTFKQLQDTSFPDSPLSTGSPSSTGFPSTSTSGLGARSNSHRKSFPNLKDFYPSKRLNSRQSSSSSSSDSEVTAEIFASWPITGPLLNRLFAWGTISTPLFSVALQRDSIEIGGNLGQLSIGALPGSVQNSSMTWVPLRLYSEDTTGLTPPPDSPNEVYPITWEVFIDAVYLDGEKLPDSTLADPQIADSALVDTGNSLIRGPQDVLETIYQKLGADSQGVFPCDTPHTLAFQIGGKVFPVDPRDFVSQAYDQNTNECMANLAVTDTPSLESGGYLNTWSLGDPFLKSVVSAFYFGNLSYPSRDPPRIGFLSTVPSDADSQYTAAIKNAVNEDNLPFTSQAAPSGVPAAAATSNGVALATQASSQGGGRNGGSRSFSIPGIWVLVGAVLGGVASVMSTA